MGITGREDRQAAPRERVRHWAVAGGLAALSVAVATTVGGCARPQPAGPPAGGTVVASRTVSGRASQGSDAGKLSRFLWGGGARDDCPRPLKDVLWHETPPGGACPVPGKS